MLGEGGKGEVGEGRPPPERKRLAELGESTGMVTGCKGARAFAPQVTELVEVACSGLDAKLVAGGLSHEHGSSVVRIGSGLRVEPLPQARDVDLHHLGRAGRRCFPPKRIDQAVTADGLVRVQKEHGQQRPLVARRESNWIVPAPYLEWAENSVFDPHRFPQRPKLAQRSRVNRRATW